MINNRQVLFNAADLAMRRLCDKRPDLRTIALQLRMTARLVLKEEKSRRLRRSQEAA